jgi:hypothetical protein
LIDFNQGKCFNRDWCAGIKYMGSELDTEGNLIHQCKHLTEDNSSMVETIADQCS